MASRRLTVQAWEEDDGWHLRFVGQPSGEDPEERSFPTEKDARRAWYRVRDEISNAKFQVLPAPPTDDE